MELRQLRYFVAVAEELHFGRAAQRLAIVQPAVSQQIGRLERELGVRLLERSSRRVVLTGDGARLLDEARAALAAADRVRAVAAELATGRAGSVRIGTSPGLGERLQRGIERLRACAPDLGLVLVDGSVGAHCAAVRSGELDVALVRGAVRVRGLHTETLWSDPVSVVLPAAHPLAAREVVPVAALGDTVLRLPDRAADATLHDAVIAACRAAGFTPCVGRPVRSVEDAVVEIGAGDRDATVVYGQQAMPAAVAVRPLDPPLQVPGVLVAPADRDTACLSALAAAFG